MSKEISSFAVFDLETACLPDWNFNKTKITEICIQGINAEDVSNGKNCNEPRINHNMTLVFNPFMSIHPESERITGLCNEILEKESPLDENAATLILNFLKHLQKPVCLVAHNGNKFDFPILKDALSKVGVELPSDILCLDSLPTFKTLDLLKNEAENDLEDFCPLSDTDLKTDIKTRHNSFKTDVSIELPVQFDKTNNEETIKESEGEHKKLESPNDWQKVNEITPKRPPNYENIERKGKRPNEDNFSCTPLPKSRKSLFNSTPSTTPSISLISTPTKSYKLCSIYERIFGSEPKYSHNAEGDVIALKKIMLNYGKSFVNYAKENAKPFIEVKKVGAV